MLIANYKPTILNISSIGLILIDNFLYWRSYLKGESYEFGSIALMLSISVGILGLLIVLVFQKLFRNPWLMNGLELGIVLAFIWLVF